MSNSLITVGIDVGSSAVKVCALEHRGDDIKLLGLECQRIRRREPRSVITDAYDACLENAKLSAVDVDYVATTGEGDLVDFRRGHFYGMTAHARGAIFLEPEARAVLDIGALHARAIKIDHRGKVLGHRMTSQCASGSGQFLENIARYLGVTLDEVGSMSVEADAPETVSSICAVLAETDVINMVSRGLTKANILKGIHLSMAGRFVKLLGAAKVTGIVILSGGLAADDGLLAAMREEIVRQEHKFEIRRSENSVYSGALGTAIWGAYRHRILERRKQTDPSPPPPTLVKETGGTACPTS